MKHHFLCISCQFKGLLAGLMIINFILSYRAILGSIAGAHWAFRNVLGHCLRRATSSQSLHIQTKLTTPFSVVIPIFISLLLMLHHIMIIFLISLWLSCKPNRLKPSLMSPFDGLSPFDEPIISYSTQYHVNSLHYCWMHWYQ